jgi:uncharacterized protein with ParB-like and HNH nuclease domain
MNNNIQSEKKDINSIFSDFWFVIPEYQRSYVWNDDNINDLLDDLWFACQNKNDNEYFLGSLVLKRTGERDFDEFEVLDGQQRLTTFFMLMAVIRDLTKNEQLKNVCKEGIHQEKVKFKGIPERVRIVYRIKDDVGDFINEFILKENGTKKPEIKEKIGTKNISISHMAKAIDTIHKFFKDKTDDIENFENFAVFFRLKAVFIYVSTESMEDAFRMFTILNNRGIPLSNTDILKAINIGAVDGNKDNKELYAKRWESIEGDLGGDFDRFLSFIRTLLVKEKARANLVEEYEENIYKKNLLRKGRDTIELIMKYKDIYDKTITLDNNSEIDDNAYKNLVTIMDIGLSSGDWIPPLLSYYNKFRNKQLLEFIEKLEYKFSSDWILQMTPTTRIENMNNILKQIEESENPDELLQNNKLFEVNNESLKETLNGDVYGRRFARYILLKYEYLQSENTVQLSNYKTISVEHILPQNPDDSSEWKKDFSDKEREDWLHKLANLVLISGRKNSKLSNCDFQEKKKKYLEGRIDIFRGSKVFIEQKDGWDVKTLKDRQELMIQELINS